MGDGAGDEWDFVVLFSSHDPSTSPPRPSPTQHLLPRVSLSLFRSHFCPALGAVVHSRPNLGWSHPTLNQTYSQKRRAHSCPSLHHVQDMPSTSTCVVSKGRGGRSRPSLRLYVLSSNATLKTQIQILILTSRAEPWGMCGEGHGLLGKGQSSCSCSCSCCHWAVRRQARANSRVQTKSKLPHPHQREKESRFLGPRVHSTNTSTRYKYNRESDSDLISILISRDPQRLTGQLST
jgi:hypothetical protein